MTCNFVSLRESKTRCNLGWSEYEQVASNGCEFAASSTSGGTTAVRWRDASRGGPPRWGDAHRQARFAAANSRSLPVTSPLWRTSGIVEKRGGGRPRYDPVKSGKH